MTDIEAGPPELVRIVRLGDKGPCGAKCGCRKAPVLKPDLGKNDYQRNFLDVFKLYYIHDATVIYWSCQVYWSCLRSSRVGVLEERCS